MTSVEVTCPQCVGSGEDGGVVCLACGGTGHDREICPCPACSSTRPDATTPAGSATNGPAARSSGR